MNDMITTHIVSLVYECVHNLSPAYFSDYFTWIENVSLVYECVHNLSPAYFSDYFTWIENVCSFSTRQSRKGDLFALVIIELNMDFHLSNAQVFGFGILFKVTYEILFLSLIFVLKLNLIFYQIIAQHDTYIYVVHRFLMNVLICEILQT